MKKLLTLSTALALVTLVLGPGWVTAGDRLTHPIIRLAEEPVLPMEPQPGEQEQPQGKDEQPQQKEQPEQEERAPEPPASPADLG